MQLTLKIQTSTVYSISDTHELMTRIETTAEEEFVTNIHQLLSSGFERAVSFASRGTEAAIAARAPFES